MMNQKKQIVALMALLLLAFSGCKQPQEEEGGGNFIKPYYDTILSCLDENHPFITEAESHNFELSDDAKLFESGDLMIEHVVFSEDSYALCSDVKVDAAWWDSLPEEYPGDNELENVKITRKVDIVYLLFSTCFINFLTGGAQALEEVTPEALDELQKVVAKCGPKIGLYGLKPLKGFEDLFKKESEL